MDRLRVLIIHDNVPFFPGPGSSTRVYCLTRELAKKHEITFLLSIQRDQQADKVRALSSFSKVVYAETDSQGQDIPDKVILSRIYWKINSIFPITNKLFYEIMGLPVRIKEGKQAYSALANELERMDLGRFDLIQIEPAPLAPSIRKHAVTIPKVLTWHDVLSAIQQREYLGKIRKSDQVRAWVQWQKMLKYETQIVSTFDHSIVTSELDAKRLQDLNAKSNPSIVPNGVDCEYFTNTAESQEEPRTLVFTGLMDYEPNIDAVLYFCDQVLPIIQSIYQDINFYIVGARPTSAVKQLAERYPGVVTVTGSVEDVRPYQQKAALSVVPLRNGGGTRLKILEALSMQKAVVSTSIGCEGLNLTDGENILNADSPERFADKVILLLSDPSFRKQISAKGYDFVRNNYDWKIIAEKQEAAWEKTILNYKDRVGRTSG